MLFNSAEFCLLFFPLITGLFFLLPKNQRWLLLLLASCWFYMAFVPLFILILAFTICVDYVAGIAIERSEGPRRKVYLIASIIANVGVLAVFKYWDFLNGNLTALFGSIGVEYHVPKLKEWTFFGWLPAGMVLPIGLSFHTFQSLSYTIEVYRGHQKAEHRIGVFALYVMFYPQLVAGPIERPGNLLNQLNASDGHGIRSDFDYDRIVWGLKQMLWGFFKKLVIADRCGAVVDQVYGHVGQYEALSLLLATYLFAFQIYCDFSGYTDIASGAARVMGFDLMVNFRTPYRSASICEFWSRWHISLSSWFRDYLYIPLGGNRVVKWRWYYNLFVVFLVSGLWHGANWTYIIWGGLHGLYLVLALVFAPFWKRFDNATGLLQWPRLKRALNILITFHLVIMAWVFFRANHVQDAFTLYERLISTPWRLADLRELYDDVPTGILDLTAVLTLLFVLIDPIYDAWIKRERPWPHRWRGQLAFAVLAVAILLFGYFGSTSFIYFQF
ncbi:MAG TPA: MBOAT family O-acyltransferase, partial [Flavobacteriales bacterium]|nr:MBOAT family O-acyltransferase [Flavobacteriales bacterium]